MVTDWASRSAPRDSGRSWADLTFPPASPLGDFPVNKYSCACGQPCAVAHLISGTQTGPQMDSEKLQRAWELIAEKAAQESDPQKHLKLIDELLRVMHELQASRAEDKRNDNQK
jgi:hypothetical protein